MTDEIIKIISEVLETPVGATASQATCEKWDSLQHLNIIVALEEAFDLSFEPEEIAEMKSVAAIENVIKIHQK
jgi:acyl carrier protein